MFKVNDPANVPARFKVGDWAYNNRSYTGEKVPPHNARVLSVVWDKALHGYSGGWRYNVPGLSDPDLYAENPDAPYGQYQQVGARCWKYVGPCGRDDQNLPAA